MLWYFVVGMLAAFGAYCALWAVLGWLLPEGRGCAIVCVGPPDEGILTRSKWLRDMGLLRLPLIVVGEAGAPVSREMENCSREELIDRLERERNRVHGTGNGDHTGHHQRGGVPEL